MDKTKVIHTGGKKSLTFMAACRDFFGLKDGQQPMDFAKEIKDLTQEDRKDLGAGLEQNGYEITNPA